MRERWAVVAVGGALLFALLGVSLARWRWSPPSPAPCDALLDRAWVEAESGRPVQPRVHRLPGFCEIVFLADEAIEGMPRVAVVAAGVDSAQAPRDFDRERSALLRDPSVQVLVDTPDQALVHWRRQRVLLVRAEGVWARWAVADRYIPADAPPVDAWAARAGSARGLAEERP